MGRHGSGVNLVAGYDVNHLMFRTGMLEIHLNRPKRAIPEVYRRAYVGHVGAVWNLVHHLICHVFGAWTPWSVVPCQAD